MVRDVGQVDHRAVERGDAEEQRRLVLRAVSSRPFGSGPAGPQHRRRADPVREREVVAQPVRVVELRRRERDVVRADGRASRARRSRTCTGCRDAGARRPSGSPVEPPLNSQNAMSSAMGVGRRALPAASSRDSNVAARHRARRAGARPRVLGDDELRVGVARVVAEVVGGVEERHRHRHGARCASRRGTAPGTSASRRGPSARGPRGRRRVRRARCRPRQIRSCRCA